MQIEHAVIVTRRTRLETLTERFNSRRQAQFYVEHSGGDFADYEKEYDEYHRSLERVRTALSGTIRYTAIDRSFVPAYLFSEKDAVIVVGQDGLVANTAKYALGIPIIAVNPDPERFDGVLLPFNVSDFLPALERVRAGGFQAKRVTMAQALLGDRQRLLAFNDLFIGPRSHISARYSISFKGATEEQSSSGIIVATGAGSTGWLSSLFNMANGIARAFAGRKDLKGSVLAWDAEDLVFVVREPFVSQVSFAGIVAGTIGRGAELVIESHMPSEGVIFSDGVETDFLRFNSGAVARIGVAPEQALLVV